MSPNKTNELFLILESRRQLAQQLKELDKATDKSFEAKAFRFFMAPHQIEHLGEITLKIIGTSSKIDRSTLCSCSQL